MTIKGRLFIFEGPDGSGKTTLATAFASSLNQEGLVTKYFSFPGKEPGSLGKHVWNLHHDAEGSGVKCLTPTSLQLLHIAAHIDTIETGIRPALAEGVTVVLDRFWWSTWIYGLVAGVDQQILRAMINLERRCWGKLRPTLIFLLIRNLGNKKHRLPPHDKVVEEYSQLAIREAQKYPVRRIHNEGPLERTLSAIIYHAHSPSPLQRRLSLDCPESRPGSPSIFSKLSPARPTTVYDTYWHFAAERQGIFFRRLIGEPRPWTDDPILQAYKFTNAYRASDRVSQYLIRSVIYQGDQSPIEVFFRVLLFKLFNKIETWELLTEKLGPITYKEYSFDRYDAILSAALERHQRIYSAAYIMPTGSRGGITRKHRAHLKLLERMMKDELPLKLTDARTMFDAFQMLRCYPMIGDFLAYQYVTDLNYSCITNFSETEFVAPGPGARSGIRKCFESLGGLNEIEIIRVVTMRQEEEFKRLGIKFQSLWGRPLQYIDCQNIFCEVDKYSRFKHPEISGIGQRTRIKQKFRFSRLPIEYWFPPKWGLNEKIAAGTGEQSHARL